MDLVHEQKQKQPQQQVIRCDSCNKEIDNGDKEYICNCGLGHGFCRTCVDEHNVKLVIPMSNLLEIGMIDGLSGKYYLYSWCFERELKEIFIVHEYDKKIEAMKHYNESKDIYYVEFKRNGKCISYFFVHIPTKNNVEIFLSIFKKADTWKMKKEVASFTPLPNDLVQVIGTYL